MKLLTLLFFLIQTISTFSQVVPSVTPGLKFKYKGDILKISEYDAGYISNLNKAVKSTASKNHKLTGEYYFDDQNRPVKVIYGKHCGPPSLAECNSTFLISYSKKGYFKTIQVIDKGNEQLYYSSYMTSEPNDSTFKVTGILNDDKESKYFYFKKEGNLVSRDFTDTFKEQVFKSKEGRITSKEHFEDGVLKGYYREYYKGHLLTQISKKDNFKPWTTRVHKYLPISEAIDIKEFIKVKDNDFEFVNFYITDKKGNVTRLIEYNSDRKKYRWEVTDYLIEYRK